MKHRPPKAISFITHLSKKGVPVRKRAICWHRRCKPLVICQLFGDCRRWHGDRTLDVEGLEVMCIRHWKKTGGSPPKIIQKQYFINFILEILVEHLYQLDFESVICAMTVVARSTGSSTPLVQRSWQLHRRAFHTLSLAACRCHGRMAVNEGILQVGRWMLYSAA